MSLPEKNCICEFCGSKFKEQRYLSRHLTEGKECRKLRGILFACLRCGGFHTTKFGELQKHLEDCQVDGRISDVMENYQCKIETLTQRVKYLEEILQKGSFKRPTPVVIKIDKEERRQKILDETFGNSSEDIVKRISSEYELAKTAKKYNSYLKTAKRLRRIIFKNGDLDFYTLTVESNIQKLVEILEDKKFTGKKIRKIMRQHFTALDLRLVRYDEHEQLAADGSLLKELSLVLSCVPKPKFFDKNKFIQSFLNYSLILFPVENILKRELISDNPTYVFMGDPSSNRPFEFYSLSVETVSVKKWIMDSRMGVLVPELRAHLLPYLVKIFRELFFTIYNDNNYREDWLGNLQGLEHDCKQIVKNILVISNTKLFSKICRNIVIKNNHHIKEDKDILNLTRQDPIHNVEPNETKEYIHRLFDDISKEEIGRLVGNL